MTRPTVRLAVGIGDPERERLLLPALAESENLRVVDRCLSADQLLETIASARADVVLVAYDLHRLTSSSLSDLDATGVTRVLLVQDAEDPRWQATTGVVLPLDADVELVRQGIDAALHGERFDLQQRNGHVQPEAEEATTELPQNSLTRALSLIGVASGPGSPGRTTVALNLATALGAVQPTILVDADMAGPSIAAQLDADPTRNMYMVAHAEPDAPWEWDRAIQSEAQPLERSRSPYADVLCGVPKPDMRGRITRRFLERLVHALQRRYRYVVLDTGSELLGAEGAVHRAALGLSQQVLLVCSSDLVGLWRARTTLGLLQTHLQIGSDGVALIVNRHDPRFHHSRAEIEWALSARTAAVVPYDNVAAQRALASQKPLVLGRGAAARALLDLTERLHGGKLVLPPAPARERRRWLRMPTMRMRREQRAS
jgi:MinD-like ATPase involved in chromosome partitioning or flagellar assembly